MRHLVTGGAGFLGSHLVDSLIKDNQEVICLDNFHTGKKRNVAHLIGHKNFELIRHDVIEPILLEVDRIWHLACPASPVQYQINPIKTIKTSFFGTYNMLGLAKRSGARILFTSTSEIYGDPQIHPQPEYYLGNVNTIGPRACYDEGKRISETLMTDYKRVNNVQIRIARIFNTYGPRMLKNDGRVVSNFITQALANKPITVYGTGTQTRCFCYVDDMVNGLKKLMDSDCSKPINLGNPVEITVNELAMRITNKINAALPHVNLPLPEDDPQRRNPDMTLAKETLDWLPTVSLDDGLDETIDYFKSFKKITWNKEASY